MLQRQTQSTAFWTDDFRATGADIEHIMGVFLEEETPLTNQEIALRTIEFRLQQESERLQRIVDRGELFQPKGNFQVGQELVFPAFGYALGKVLSARAGDNPEHGEFGVLTVEFEDHKKADLAFNLQTPHRLNLNEGESAFNASADDLTAEDILVRYGETIIDEIEARLVDEKDAIFFGGRWFLRSLLTPVNVGQMHLAEAILDINEGGPLPTATLLKDVELAKEVPELVKEFSLDIALSQDERFDEVGPTGRVAWFLRRLEPPEVVKMPERLVYHRLEYDRTLLSAELSTMELELDDEYSDLPTRTEPAHEATLTLIYPHRRVGTLPLTSRLLPLFPTAQEASRIRITFVDGQTNEEFAGWVVQDKRYVVGLDTFYRAHRLPIGAYVTIKRTDDPARLIIDYEAHRPHSEYIRLAVPVNHKLTFANFKRSIGAGYDELLILGAEDLEAVDAIWSATTKDRRRGLADVMRDLMPELSKLNPQNAVHVKTLYSAVNVIRRCPPGPIFAALVARPEFEHMSGPYWRVSS